ncbi:MAG TPA: hypothetical protein VKY32_09235 [Flavobacterium sp.]|nr:hypothetical protein [Flavobacterium sp.]
MKVRKHVSEVVQIDLTEIAFWYNQQRKGLGMLFLKEIRKEVRKIEKNPLAYQIRYANIRIAFINKFLYGIHFEYLEDKLQVNILAVFHTSRNTKNWENKL